MPRPVITLTTDFGRADSYVGAMAGVILGICPEAVLTDITHEIRPQAVRQAAYVLSTATPYFPLGTVHLVVVDPGVGSQRRAVAVQTERAAYIAPDNGVLSVVLSQDTPRLSVHLTNARYHRLPVSATFHGRDIFAPVAAHLAAGVPICDLGDPIPPSDLVRLSTFQPVLQSDGSWLCEILHIDRFGNLITNLPSHLLAGLPLSHAQLAVSVGGARIQGLSRSFADVKPGGLVTYVGSSGYLEIAVRGGNAATRLGVDVGSPVYVAAGGSP